MMIHQDQVGFIPGMHDWFNFLTIYIVHIVNRINKEKHTSSS